MPSVAKCGNTGSTSFGTDVTMWEATVTADMQDVTSFQSAGAREFKGCLIEASGTFRSLTPSSAPGLVEAVDFTNADGALTGNVIVESVRTVVDVQGLVQYEYAWQSTGAMSWA